ncbi:MAG: TetR/AcrR family transcriptional regulator [Streptococcaceae bacterium]|jgi:AcrR family transcriptional regulator|nr:TetR/AcrR family transcriptional regulator [Streptococcaceae bacterium]
MPRNNSRDTKEEILSASLKFFSEKGYDGVGVRDIANEIGIRESALYKHFNSKKNIFDGILKDIERRYQEESAAFFPLNEDDAKEELFRISLAMFQFYLKAEYGSQLRKMLTIEQYRNSEAGEFFRELIINQGLEQISGVFTALIKDEVYVEDDPMIMALQFYSSLYLLLCKYDNQPDKYEDAVTLLKRHITQFNKNYLRRDTH